MAAGSSKKAVYAAIAGNGAIAVTKFIAGAATGSSAMLAEGVHSLVDTGQWRADPVRDPREPEAGR